MPLSTHSGPSDTPPPALADIAARFVQARRQGRSLPDFPGIIPDDLETAYRVQDLAIAQWPDRVVGWKVGYIAAERRDHSGDERLLGPIFARNLWNATGGTMDIPVFAGGFGAVEAEYVMRLDADVPADQLQWTPEQASQVPSTLFIGVEVASSPLATINQLGPRVVISDFGNNNGLLLGPQVADWTTLDESALLAETLIEGQRVGCGGATLLPGGLRTAFAFALARSARRGRPLKRGELIATGNATGIHDIAIGQHATIRFDGYGELHCRAVAA
ncbi:2-keto-4-pentenoate hydratase [Xanthomonas translucens]|nr:2-keto-4-pentenoate hydratase [Xanthomonas translucens]MCC8448433.1 2-keto-4-pentenoate hydratase [Xanthomonas translucens pv. translucens]MCT8287040.1 2-keto-4-pentenoate hydratase [Xanthomonas translucens pv. translucens]MCT8304698.1 2-keto-4-pentenoate hydratase [Xanthomonas translucens pv. translucens]QSQ32086.1 2-keto-4-pentenoate hydratase [Xanthomonas translucens pv. translucens]UKE52528.1 2-keto-4-pentenoate hydratase [Xanthomonas translucens]